MTISDYSRDNYSITNQASYIDSLFEGNNLPDRKLHYGDNTTTGASSLYLKLFNDTFLSLPLLDCENVNVRPQNEEETNENQFFDACYVDWMNANIIQQRVQSLKQESLTSILDNYYDTKFLSNTNNDIESSYFNHFEFIRLSYLSFSSILSLCGLLINLFIILIILFNTRQKKKNSNNIRCSGINSTGHNNSSLLFQLTLTGIILTSFVLIENFNNYKNHTNLGKLINLDQQTKDDSLCRFFSALSSLLPPTPFDSDRIICENYYFENNTSRYDSLKNLVLLLKFETFPIEHKTTNYSSFYILSKDGDFISIDQTLRTFFMASKSCLTSGNSSSRYQTRNGNGDFKNDEQYYQDFMFSNLLDSNLINLMVNVVASVHIWTVASLAYDRYYAIANPLQYLSSYHALRRKTFFIVIWASSLILSLLLPLSLRLMKGYNLESNYKLDRLSSDIEVSSADRYVYNCQYKMTNFQEYNGAALRSNLVTDFVFALLKTSMSSNNSTINLDNKTELNHFSEKLYISSLIAFSLFCFAIIILVPLSIITICNVGIYKIVKAHQRRLSTGSTNNSTTANLLSSHQFNDRSETTSIASLLLSKLVKGAARNPSRQEDFSFQPKCKFCDCEKTADKNETSSRQDSINSTVLNRSKRLITRQDSYQKIITKLNENKHHGSWAHSSSKTASCNSIVMSPTHHHHQQQQQQKNGLKRKISDHSILVDQRKSSIASQPEVGFVSKRDADAEFQAGFLVDHVEVLDSNRYEAGSILYHLKMAGLSFAGISLQGGKLLNKSTSCSFGNLYNNTDSPSRCAGMDAGHQATNFRKSCVLLNNIKPQFDSPINYSSKYTTRVLVDSENENSQNGLYNNFNHHSQSRLPLMIGTKSAAFNIVIWLVISMLILTLPHYLLVTINQIIKLNMKTFDLNQELEYREDLYGYQKYNHNLQDYIGLNLVDRFNRNSTHSVISEPNQIKTTDQANFKLLQLTSAWFSCLCRLLFLSIIPLNGWLYGMRSRSLKATIRMVLRRYISRKQASIEIGQRQRSITSMKSRDSSILNLANQTESSGCVHCNFNENVAFDASTTNLKFDRCSSFNQVNRRSSHLSGYNSRMSSLKKIMDRSCSVDESTSIELNLNNEQDSKANVIKFLIGDYSGAESDMNVRSVGQAIPSDLGLQTSSLTSSLTSSSRSITSGNPSLALSLFDRKESINAEQIASVEFQDHAECSSLHGNNIKFNGNDPTSDLSQQVSMKSVAFDDLPRVCVRVYDEQPKNEINTMKALTKSSVSLENNEQATGDINLRKSSSDFKFYVTSTEEHHLVDFEVAESVEKDFANIYNDLSTGPLRKQSIMDDLYQHMRDNALSKIIFAASAKFFDRKSLETKRLAREAEKQRADNNMRSEDHNQRVALLRKNSESSQSVTRGDCLKLSNNKKRITSSSTMNYIGANVNPPQRISSKCLCCRQHNCKLDQRIETESFSDTQSPSYLKPPNFLKFVFDSDNHVLDTYTNPSALSPIKECSSNHSYASSLSSLNNTAAAAVATASQLVLSQKELSQETVNSGKDSGPAPEEVNSFNAE